MRHDSIGEIGEMRSPTWNPRGESRSRAVGPVAGVVVLALGVAAAVGLYMRQEEPKSTVAMAPAGEQVTLPVPTESTAPPVTELPALPPAPAAAADSSAEVRSTAAPRRNVSPNPATRAERSANATPPARVAEAALRPLPETPKPIEPAVTPMPAPTPTPMAPPQPAVDPAPPAAPSD
ncbi:hypothetical protein HLB44_22035 [Aquincola sp. S2]|uniref:Uncharacterized protein n=1 Tax=Pseudaquabacterium terrae TaxID=2732868 RepID=A0ABX2EM74_9BURK|nr:hypothetical protein [Aquabacterium terrae]NRF69689.1 hypothetical protein [Aquabacterium terrae]